MRGGAVLDQLRGRWTKGRFLPWIIAGDFREHRGQRSCEADQRIVLLRSEIVLLIHLALHNAFNDFLPGRSSNEILRADSTIAELGGNLDGDLAAGIFFVPLVQWRHI